MLIKNPKAERQEFEQKAPEYIDFLEKNGNKIPNINALLTKLKKDPSIEHIVHADFVKRFVEDGRFQITGVEISTGIHDIDIQLDNSISIQVWHGASTHNHNIERGKIDPKGGVQMDLQNDVRAIQKKLNQLPDDSFGLLICYNRNMGLDIFPTDEFFTLINNMPKNKALAVVSYNGHNHQSSLYHQSEFDYLSKAKDVLDALRFHLISS
ncbi:MAG TPA: hypothetical protein VJA47_01945 [archaeon]|nr:hypothetical protein [archaeon]